MYYEYWGMTRHPFDNVPDPTMYFRAHESVETAVAEVLFAIEEGDEVLAVIVGEVGLGKTTTLRVVLDNLEQDKYRIAFVTNPDVTFTMLLREIIGQLRGQPCEMRRKDDLLEEFNRILFETADEGKRVLVFIDEGNAFKPVNLESLRLITNMQEDDRNLFTIILAGQPKLARMLESPKRANLFQRIGVYCRLSRIENWETVRDYIDHRLERAGTTSRIFTDDAVRTLYHYSENGIPRLINKIAKLALKAGETNQLTEIGPEIIAGIGERFKRFTRSDDGISEEHDLEGLEKKLAEAGKKVATVEAAEESHLPLMAETEEALVEAGGDNGGQPADVDHGFYSDHGQDLDFEDTGMFYSATDRSAINERAQTTEEIDINLEQVCIDEALRPDVLEKARNADKVERMKLAGQIAAEEIKKHPEVVSNSEDPVVMWKELRSEILSAFTAEVNS